MNGELNLLSMLYVLRGSVVVLPRGEDCRDITGGDNAVIKDNNTTDEMPSIFEV